MTELLPLPKINARSDTDDTVQPTPVELSDEQLSSILTNMVSWIEELLVFVTLHENFTTNI